ncbi:hypothetical protein EYB33_16930 [Lysinibacillus sphaericus]|uniref:hypothetical protein n=1 Tax=Lysinibacillus sphaericus TaxID=1421 RepID=UPI001E4C8408|nr:hypothetical protein [Lysinibacillus sphaericus]UDK97888.1 hypothetical protein EYB33_16930 [Lysinibacillus sphaericus]
MKFLLLNSPTSVQIPIEVSTSQIDLLRYIWVIPILIGFITFILTSLFTIYREKRNNLLEKRAFIEYHQYELNYPFNDNKDGLILTSIEGKKTLELYKENSGICCFLEIKNITENDILNLKIEVISESKRIVKQEFALPIWKNDTTLYIPITIHDGNTHFVTDHKLDIQYTTLAFEKFSYGYYRTKDKKYNTYLKKYYFFNLIPITKIKYSEVPRFTYIKLEKKE